MHDKNSELHTTQHSSTENQEKKYTKKNKINKVDEQNRCSHFRNYAKKTKLNSDSCSAAPCFFLVSSCTDCNSFDTQASTENEEWNKCHWVEGGWLDDCGLQKSERERNGKQQQQKWWPSWMLFPYYYYHLFDFPTEQPSMKGTNVHFIFFMTIIICWLNVEHIKSESTRLGEPLPIMFFGCCCSSSQCHRSYTIRVYDDDFFSLYVLTMHTFAPYPETEKW